MKTNTIPTNEKRSRNCSKARSYLMDILSGHEIFQGTSAELWKKFHDMKKIFNLPGYCWEYLRGYMDCKIDSWQRNSFVFCYVFEGNLYEGNWDTMPENVKEFIRENPTSNIESGHYWRNKDGSIGRVWFSSKS